MIEMRRVGENLGDHLVQPAAQMQDVLVFQPFYHLGYSPLDLLKFLHILLKMQNSDLHKYFS